MLKKLKPGDKVNILPYGMVPNHDGINKRRWKGAVENNPHTIRLNEGGYKIEGSEYFWPFSAIEKVIE